MDGLAPRLVGDPDHGTLEHGRVLGEEALYEYADPLSSINLHYARPGQELGWHFDNSSFAITLMIQDPEAGGAFEYVSGLRDADAGEMNFEMTARVLDGEVEPRRLTMAAGTLVLFRGGRELYRFSGSALPSGLRYSTVGRARAQAR